MTKHWDQLGNLDHLAVGLNATLGDPWHGNGAFDGAVPLDAAIRVLTINAAKLPLQRLVVTGMNADGSPHEEAEPVLSYGKPLYGIFDQDTGHCFQAGVSEGYVIHDYTELVDQVASILDAGAGDVEIGSVISLGMKEQAFVQIRPKEGVTVGGDQLLPFIAGYSSLDSSLATGFRACRTRVVCDNTQAMCLNEKQATYRIKHTKNSQLKVNEARAMLGVLFDGIPRMVAEVDRYQNTGMTDAAYRMLIERLFPLKDDKGIDLDGRSLTIATSKRETLARMWVTDKRVSPYRNTVWGAIQAVNTATTHEFTVRGAAKGFSRTDRQAGNLISGRTATLDTDTIAAINGVFETMGLATV